jgi:hypothetical protein
MLCGRTLWTIVVFVLAAGVQAMAVGWGISMKEEAVATS